MSGNGLRSNWGGDIWIEAWEEEVSDPENRYWQEAGVHIERGLRVSAERAEHKAG